MTSTPTALFPAANRRPPKSNTLTWRVDDDMLEKIAKVGTKNGLSMSETLRLLVEDGLTVWGSGESK